MTLGGGCGIPRLRPWPANGARALLPVPDFAPHTPRHPRQLPTFFSPFFRHFLSFLGIFFCFSKDNPTHAWYNHTYLGACFTVCWDGTTEQERKKSEILVESVLLLASSLPHPIYEGSSEARLLDQNFICAMLAIRGRQCYTSRCYCFSSRERC